MFFTSCPLHEIVSQGGLYMWTNVSNVFNFHLEQKAVKLCWALPSGASLKVPTCLLCRCFLWNGDALTKWGSWWYKLCWEIEMSKRVDGILLPFLPILILIFLGTGTVYAQWSAVDSWWFLSIPPASCWPGLVQKQQFDKNFHGGNKSNLHELHIWISEWSYK